MRGARERLVEILRQKGISDLSVLRAFELTPRHVFVPTGVRHRAYEDTSLPIGNGQTISQLWNAAVSQSGANVTVTSNVSWNATIAPGSSMNSVGFNDRTASLIVYTGQWELCTDDGFSGRCSVFGPGRYAGIGGLSNQISSLRRVDCLRPSGSGSTSPKRRSRSLTCVLPTAASAMWCGRYS